MHNKKCNTGSRHCLALIAYWTFVITVLTGVTLYLHRQYTIHEAKAEARDAFRLNMFYRLWAAQMGGLYVSADRVEPNPFLAIADRDVTTVDGKRLTLVNPAYMTRMVFDTIKKSSKPSMISKITSLKPLNPANAPDEWERRALDAFERREFTEQSEVMTINNEPYLRFISAFIIEEPCLKCHAVQGYHMGDIRGAITLSIPLAERYRAQRNLQIKTGGGYLLLWVMGCCGIVAGCRKQDKYQRELEESEQKLRIVCDWTLDWDYWVDADRAIQYISPSCLKITGYAPDEFIADPQLVHKIVHPDHHDSLSDHFITSMCASNEESYQIEFAILTKGGEKRWIQHNCAPIFHQGEFKGRRVSNRDITDQKLANEKVSRLSAIVESSDDAIISTSLDGVITSWNHGAELIYGYTEQEMVGNSLLRLFPPDRLHEEEQLLPTICRGESIEHFETARLHKNGGLLDVSVRISPIHDHRSGEIIGVSKIARDISEAKRQAEERSHLEHQMFHTQKLESLGVLAGGIAHDFNNILLAILGNAELALMRVDKETPAANNLRNVQEAAMRAADLARQMLAYSGKGSFTVENIDLNLVIKEMTHILEVSISKQAALRFDLCPQLPAVAADATQIRQIVMNLVINASEAIGEGGGTIALSTGYLNCHRDHLQRLMLDQVISEGCYVYFEVADTGCGMDEKTISKIYDPFFTTKFTGRGLGMAAVQGIIRGHHGAIKVVSTVGKGTTFRVFLPATEMPENLLNGDPLDSEQWRGSGTVLLVDDEESVLKIGAEMLREMGFDVLTARDGREGVDLFAANSDKISCVLLDLTMPNMDGQQAFQALRNLDPEVKVVLCSGYNKGDVIERLNRKGLAAFIHKPYQYSTLQQTLCRIVAQ